MRYNRQGRRNLPGLGLDGLGELAVLAGSNAIKVIANILRKLEGARVALVERREERRKKAACWLLRLFDRDRALCDADEAVPRLVQLTRLLFDRRIEACEVKCSIASIATEQIAAAATRRAEVVVLGALQGVSDVVLRWECA